MKRIYYTWEKWECYPAGFYKSAAPNGMSPTEANGAYAMFLKDPKRFGDALKRVIAEWPNSTEHYLSNEKMNRIAWLGQAAMCIATGVPACYRGGFNLLSDEMQALANAVALKALNEWLASRGEPTVDMEGAGVNAVANIY